MRAEYKGLISRVVRTNDSVVVYINEEVFKKIVNKEDFSVAEAGDYILNMVEAKLGIMDIMEAMKK